MTWYLWMLLGALAARYTLPLLFAFWRAVTVTWRRPITKEQLRKLDEKLRV